MITINWQIVVNALSTMLFCTFCIWLIAVCFLAAQWSFVRILRVVKSFILYALFLIHFKDFMAYCKEKNIRGDSWGKGGAK